MNLRSDRVAQSGEVEVGVERGVDLDAAVHDALLSSFNGGLGVGRGVLVVVLVGHDANAALVDADKLAGVYPSVSEALAAFDASGEPFVAAGTITLAGEVAGLLR